MPKSEYIYDPHTAPVISVIMPSFLYDYENAASAREFKFIRAVSSFLENDYKNKELVICSDGCDITTEIYERRKNEWPQVKLVCLTKQPLFSGTVRQHAIDNSSGEFIAYLDTDDEIGISHLRNIVTRMKETNYDWCYFKDVAMLNDGRQFRREVEITHGKIGTTFIAHKKIFANGYAPTWAGTNGYGEDWQFIQRMKTQSNNCGKINGCEYLNRHIPYLQTDN